MRYLWQFAEASISTAELLERYRTACDFKQPVDRDRITSAIRRWFERVGIPLDTTIRFCDSKAEVMKTTRAARAALIRRDRTAARIARIAWDAKTARDARQGARAWGEA